MGSKTNPASLRVLILEDEPVVCDNLASLLTNLGHTAVGFAASARSATELFRANAPDLVLVDIRLGNEDGIQLASQLLAERPCAMVIVSAYADEDLIERASEAGVFGYLVKPVSEASLAAQIAVATSRFADTQRLRAEKQKLAADLETRKLMDRAKGVLMKRAGLSEADAHRRLQQESQKRRLAMPDLCRRIIESDELMG